MLHGGEDKCVIRSISMFVDTDWGTNVKFKVVNVMVSARTTLHYPDQQQHPYHYFTVINIKKCSGSFHRAVMYH